MEQSHRHQAFGTQRDVTGTPGEGGRAVRSRHLASTTAGTAAATPPRGHTSHSRPDWHSLVEQHSPGLLAGKKMLLPVAVTEAPRPDYLSLTPFRPGRGYGAGPAAVKGGSTGLVMASTRTTAAARIASRDVAEL